MNRPWTTDALLELFKQHNVPYIQNGTTVTIDMDTLPNLEQKAYTVLYPVCFHTVDMAAVRINGNKVEVLLIQKHNESSTGKWRFPGGFVDPRQTDNEAAARELFEECTIKVNPEQMIDIASVVIDDPRYKDSPHSITTSLHLVILEDEVEPVAGDDAAKVQWVELSSENIDIINDIHKELFTKVYEAVEQIIHSAIFFGENENEN